MKTQKIGRGRLMASRLAVGAWRIDADQGPDGVTADVEAAGIRAMHAADDAGYTFFDLADIYGGGACERIFGRALRERRGMRERIVVATKCGIRFPDDPAPGAPYRYDSSAEHIIRQAEGSLLRMGIDTIDLLMIHRPDFLGDPEEIAGAFERLRAAGKVREFGVSNFAPSQVSALQKACPMPLVVNQVAIHLARLEPFHDGTLDQCLADHITPMAWSPLAGGHLVGGNPAAEERLAAIRAALDGIAAARGESIGVIALAWLLKHPAGIVPIVGSTRPERIAEAARADAVDLSREEWYQLMQAASGGRLP
ncbi:MAG: aldo/keto reductase [Verrucomicrobiae bacterium]|nr:aldo/keto reductase [Verrucomicrobiae bacterium]